jgi:hypothetical protein
MTEITAHQADADQNLHPEDYREHIQLPEGVNAYLLPDHLAEQVKELELPNGYALVGGAARAVAAEMLCGYALPVRDIDIVAFDDFQPDWQFADEVSERLMTDDYTFGHGVRFETLEDYFRSRDFTFNELTVVDGALLISETAEADLINNIVRPTRFEYDPDNDEYLSAKLAVKSVLMQVVLERATGEPATIEDVDLRDYRCDLLEDTEDNEVAPFFVALGFQRALERGADVAHDFLDKLQDYGMIRAESLAHKTVVDARLLLFAEEVVEQTYNFEFRGQAADNLHSIRELVDKDYSLGDLLHAVGGDDFDSYEYYHDVAQRYGGKGREYTDESKY